jgi:pimeloyl-ACP methyl ester carboxylesterase
LSFATSGRARLAYDVTGVGPDVLLLHEGVNDRRSWHHVIARLAPGHRCVAYDMRGYGETVYEPENGWSSVADAVAVLDAADVASAVVIGGSIGAKLAIDLALAHPGRVRGLALIGAGVRGAPEIETEGRTAALAAQIDAAWEAGDLDECNRLEAWYWLDGPRGDEGRVEGEARELFLDMNDRALRAQDPGEEASLPDAWPRLGELAVPVLFLIGALDAEDIRARVEEAATLVPGARLQVLDGVAHDPQLEGDPATLDALAAFADEQA